MRDTKDYPGESNLVDAASVFPGVLRHILNQLRWLGRSRVRFQKYRVAPRLGTNAVQQRLLLGIHTHVRLTATQTEMA